MPYIFELKGYCEGCPYFDAEVESIEYTNIGEDFPRAQHTVMCRYRDHCARVVSAVHQEMVK